MVNAQLDTRFDGRERRDIITPYAFQVHPRLLGLPLATPPQRALAITLDGIAIALLAAVPGAWLGLASGIVLWIWAGKPASPRAATLRRSARLVAVVLALAAGLGLVLDRGDGDPVGTSPPLERLATSARLGALAIQFESGRCGSLECARQPLLDFAELAAGAGIPQSEAWDAATAIVAGLALSEAQRAELETQFGLPFAARAAEVPPGVFATPLAWLRATLDELGLGVGWAALYFTVFTAWWDGQTPGKRVLGIRVVQLDATPLSLWDSFERYGGYSAGLATGLFGFLRICWDANRQAIHDKICETVVIRGELPGPPLDESDIR